MIFGRAPVGFRVYKLGSSLPSWFVEQPSTLKPCNLKPWTLALKQSGDAKDFREKLKGFEDRGSFGASAVEGLGLRASSLGLRV